MASEVDRAKRLVSIQRRVAEQKRLELARRQLRLGKLTGLGEAVARTLESGGLAWHVFPDMSTRFMSRLATERNIAAQEALAAAEISLRDSRRLEILDQQLKLARRKEDHERDDAQRLESAARRSASSLPQA